MCEYIFFPSSEEARKHRPVQSRVLLQPARKILAEYADLSLPQGTLDLIGGKSQCKQMYRRVRPSTHTHTHEHVHAHTHTPTDRHTHTHRGMRTYIHTYLPTYTPLHAYLPTYTPTCLPAYVRTYVRTCTRTYRQAHKQTNIQTYKRTYIHTYIHVYMYTCIHVYIRTYVCTHVPTCLPPCLHTFSLVTYVYISRIYKNTHLNLLLVYISQNTCIYTSAFMHVHIQNV